LGKRLNASHLVILAVIFLGKRDVIGRRSNGDLGSLVSFPNLPSCEIAGGGLGIETELSTVLG